ncbi:glycosyltransferase [Agromyces bauzanensis]
MPDTQPVVLVVLPTLGDRLHSLRETLESVATQRESIALTLVVVSPDTATDARALALEYGAKLVDDPKTGISAAINRGLEARTVERYYAWIGDDDLFRPGGLITLAEVLESRPDAVLAYGGCDYIDYRGRTIVVSNAGRLATMLLSWGPDLIPHPSTMIRLDSLERIAGFDPALKYAMDLDAFLKLRRFGAFAYTRSSVSAFRWHPDSLTVSNRLASSRESEAVKRRHMPRLLRPVSLLWTFPLRWAAALAASRLNHRARTIDAASS